MERQVDRERQARRRRAGASISVAHGSLLALIEKCAELETLTRAEVGGHPRGEEIIKRAAQSRQVMKGALADLAQAQTACQAIDVTVAVPDPEHPYG